MFPFENNGEISFQVTKNEQDLILENQLLESTTTTAAAASKGRGRKSLVGSRICVPSASRPPNDTLCVDPDPDVKTKKKMVHRDIERQRRHEMSGLFSTLHSLLPSQYSKGKRSMSDHIVESVNYIKDMQKNIKVLGDKRDNLKVSHNSYNETSSSINGCNIEIYTNAVGLQVQIVACQSQQGFALSTALKILQEQGLDVVSSISNAANGDFHHNIQCQANDATCDNINVDWLKQRLYDAVC
ncbi:hypothetical protein V2J09_014523 [Rumex salicifolius]